MTPRTRPDSCSGCPLAAKGTDFSAVEGTGSLGVMLIGEASGECEARDQLPFRPYAPAGSLLERTIRRMSLDRQQFALTNVCRCHPPHDWLAGAPYEYAALDHCRPNLVDAIASRRPRCLFAMGGTALRVLTGLAGEKLGVSHLRGYVLQSLPEFGGLPVVPSFHPAFIRRGAAHLQGVFARDLQRARNVASGRDDSWLWGRADAEMPAYEGDRFLQEAIYEGSLDYRPRPSLDEAWSYYHAVRDGGAGCTLSFDLETYESASLDEDARDGFADTGIRLAQFSAAAGSGIALPWEGGYCDVARALLRLPNPKCGHNVWLFDLRVLAVESSRTGVDFAPLGTVHDTLQMFHWWQPDLPAHLQFAASFAQFPFPWKHLAGSALELYGCADVDATLRLYAMLEPTMRRDGLWDSYWAQVLEVRPVLARMESRGVPIDDRRRLALGGEFDREQARLDAELQAAFPDECRRVSPKDGYKRPPKDLEGLVERDFTVAGIAPDGEPLSATVRRWCRLEPFLPNSGPQLIAYMRHQGHAVPKSRKNERADGTAADTTEKKELQRLAAKTGDPFYLKVIESRELGKARSTYVEGFRPQADHRVHTTFTFDTGTGQLSSRNPNVQNFPKHGRLAAALRSMVAAPAGHLLTEWDYKAFHVMTTGFEADSAAYMRMARLDMHSFVAGCFLRLWQPEIIEEADDALLDRFKWFKADADRKRVRDKQAKPSILGVGFGMAKRRLYQENLENFPDERTAGKFLELLRALFPEVFQWQDRVRKLAHDQQFLRSRFGAVRRFYEVYVWDGRRGQWTNGDQAEEAVAFLPANDAHGEMRERLKALHAGGADSLAERYGLCNVVHDSFQWCLPAEALDAHIAEVGPVLGAPSRTLVSALVPGGLQVDTELSVGVNWAQMAPATITAAAAAVA